MTRDRQSDRDRRDPRRGERGAGSGTGSEDFASRWSRLKRGAGQAAGEAQPAPEGPAPAPDERSEAQILEELGLPEPETLKPGDDFAAFMAAGVPAGIRNRALRRLWGSNPVLANLDGLIDYGEDFTNAATVPEVLNTAYRVGRGWMDDPEEEAPGETTGDTPGETAGEPAGAGPEAPAEGGPAATQEPAPEAGEKDSETAGETRPAPESGEAPAAAQVARAGSSGRGGESRVDSGAESRPPPRKRMRFRFADE